MALTETQTTSVYPSQFYNPNDATPISATWVQGTSFVANVTSTSAFAPITALSATAGRIFHLTKAIVTVAVGTTTAKLSLVLAGNTITNIPTVNTSGVYSYDFGDVGVIADVASGITSTTAIVALTQTNCTTGSIGIFASGYYR